MLEQNMYLKEWEAIVNSDDLQKSLINHFSYLMQQDGDERLLEMIMARAVTAQCSKDWLKIFFKDTRDPLIATPPMKNIPEHYPESYKSLLRHHYTVNFFIKLGEDEGNNIDGYIEEFAEMDELGKEFFRADELISPLNEYGGPHSFIYHPFRKKEDGTPYLYFFYLHPTEIHLQHRDAGSAFLETVAYALQLPVKG
jgi:hypothetical protein